MEKIVDVNDLKTQLNWASESLNTYDKIGIKTDLKSLKEIIDYENKLNNEDIKIIKHSSNKYQQWISYESIFPDGNYLEFLAKVIYQNSFTTGNSNKLAKENDIFKFTENDNSKKSGSINKRAGNTESTKDSSNVEPYGTKENSENENSKSNKKKKIRLSAESPKNDITTPSKPIFFTNIIGFKTKNSGKSLSNINVDANEYTNLKLREEDLVTESISNNFILNNNIIRISPNDKSTAKCNKTKPAQTIQLVYS